MQIKIVIMRYQKVSKKSDRTFLGADRQTDKQKNSPVQVGFPFGKSVHMRNLLIPFKVLI